MVMRTLELRGVEGAPSTGAMEMLMGRARARNKVPSKPP